ncbi:alpha/beta hydrolase [Hymenobacter sp. RP-2-7]|uniref:Alpha/beta hydrolase n=1 Tax=Hymenobacter polaris TaxID=2682546 RepID=A0A7Y0FKT2_9BACT|nr:alpha/beta hydrolase [Hymenobacter polaris]NML63885.1 alpha/beta hydrolase [Hymenobacter polaris]
MKPNNRRRWSRRLLVLVLLLFVGLNAIAFMQAWRLTHFVASGPRAPRPEQLSAVQRLRLALTGLPTPRPRNDSLPAFPFQTVRFPSLNGLLEAWYAAPLGPRRGTVALFHGYGGSKSHLRHEAAAFRSLGWAVLLVDEEGSGGSAGSRTTVGYREAEDVAAAVRYLRGRAGAGPAQPLVLYGVSMGAAAITRAEAELGVRPTANILECPYGTMRQAVINRFRLLHAPVYPVADLLLFWGGVQNGFWAYGLNPETYARRINTPTLLLWGTADRRVLRAETDSIFAHLAGPKQRVDFLGSGHEPYWRRHPQQWQQVVAGWLGQLPR